MSDHFLSTKWSTVTQKVSVTVNVKVTENFTITANFTSELLFGCQYKLVHHWGLLISSLGPMNVDSRRMRPIMGRLPCPKEPRNARLVP